MNGNLLIEARPPADGALWGEYSAIKTLLSSVSDLLLPSMLISFGDLSKFDITNARHLSLLRRYNVIPTIEETD